MALSERVNKAFWVATGGVLVLTVALSWRPVMGRLVALLGG